MVNRFNNNLLIPFFLGILARSVKPFLIYLLSGYIFLAASASADNLNSAVSVQLLPMDGGFEVKASYATPLTQCQAFALLTNFSDNEPSEAIRSSKVTRLSENTVRVEQRIEDTSLLFSTQFDSIIDYTELASKALQFKQIKGYLKEYRGSWLLTPIEGGTLFAFNAFLQLDSIFPQFLVKQFLLSRMENRFEKMAARAKARVDLIPNQCK